MGWITEGIPELRAENSPWLREQLAARADSRERLERAMEIARAGGFCQLAEQSVWSGSEWLPVPEDWFRGIKSAEQSALVFSQAWKLQEEVEAMRRHPDADMWLVWLDVYERDGQCARKNTPGYTSRTGAEFEEFRTKALSPKKEGPEAAPFNNPFSALAALKKGGK